METLPEWLEKAVKDRVLSRQEALELHLVVQVAKTDLEGNLDFPEHLWGPAARVSLWMLRAPATLH